MPEQARPPKGRGTRGNPGNRFERAARIPEDDAETSSPATRFIPDAARSIVATNDSPDIPFEASLNPYRGCEHGCAYCYARPTHEYLGYSSGIDFETKILVKHEAAELLRGALSRPSWKPKVLAMSGVTDPYQPVEKKLAITRGCLKVLAEFRNPVAIITKNHLVTRDLDLLSELSRWNAVSVYVSITTLDAALSGSLEPRASRPSRRLDAISVLARAGISVGVLVAPVIPGLTDSESPAVLAAAARAGAAFAGFIPLRLPHATARLFEDWLAAHEPGKRMKVLNRIREIRGGRLNDPNFGSRMRGEGVFAEQIDGLFYAACRKAGLSTVGPSLSTRHFRRGGGSQVELFDEG